MNVFVYERKTLHFGGKLKFEQLQKRDNYIKEFSKTKNIKLIELKFDLSDNEIFQILKQLL